MKYSIFAAIGSPAIRSHRSFGMASCALPSLLILLLSLCFAVGQVQAQCGSLGSPSTTWNNGNGTWGVAGNWTSGTPGATTNACILDGTSTVTLDTNGNALGLQVASGNNLNINASGSLSLASGQTLNYGTLTNSGGTLSIIIGASFLNAGLLNNTGGTLYIDSASALSNSGGTLSNALGADLTNYGTLSNSGAALYNYGILTNYGTVFSNNAGNFTNYGTLTNASGASMTFGPNGGNLSNLSPANFTNAGTILFFDGSGSNAGTLNNSGTITLSSQYQSNLYNSGTINNSGVIVSSNLLSNSGTINTSGTISNSGTSGTCGINCGQIDNSGTINNSGAINNSGSSDMFGIHYGQFTNSGTINTSGTISNGNYGQFTNSGTITNSGILNNTAGAYLTNLGTLNNTSGANLTNAGTLNNSGVFTNSGAVTISSSGLFTTSTNYTQTGGSTNVNGTLTATGNAIVDIQGGILSGTGTINGNVAMAGTIMPGAPGTPGTLIFFGNYDQLANGTLVELMGPFAHSFLNVNGNATLHSGSFLDIMLLQGFNPLGQTFSIMDYNSLTGQFSNGSTFWDDGFLWDITYGQNQIDVTAVQAQVPEPSSLLLLLIGLAALAVYARRRMDKTQRLA